MTKQCKQLLKILNKLSESKEQSLYLDLEGMNVSNEEDKFMSLNGLSNEIEGILHSLFEDGYIVCDIPENFPYGDFRLTHKGFQWKQLQYIAIRSYLLKSIVVPIVLSIVVSILTTVISLKLGIAFSAVGSP